MKKILVLLILFAFCSNMMSQSLPIFEEGKTWVVDHTYYRQGVVDVTNTYIVRGDSVVDGISYKKVYITSKENLEDLALYYLARDENGVAYFREDDEEHVLFDFNRKVGDELVIETVESRPNVQYKGIIKEISTVEGCDGIVRKCIVCDVYIRYDEVEPLFPFGSMSFIEGIGDITHAIELDYCIDCTDVDIRKLRCVHDFNGTLIYGNDEGDNMMSQSLPIFEEGKTWVVDHTFYPANEDGDNTLTNTYIVRGDSVVDGISYKKVYITSKENLEDLALYYLARDENGVAYFRYDDKEYVFFDFNRKVGDEFMLEPAMLYEDPTEFERKCIVREKITVQGNDGVTRKCIVCDVYIRYNEDEPLYPFGDISFIEGIGEVTLYSIEIGYCIGCTGVNIRKIRCVHDANGTHIYGNGEGCKTLSIELVNGDSGADDAIYDLTGRKLNVKPEKGVYIQGGKKYIEKN